MSNQVTTRRQAADRLRRIADRIEQQPATYNQSHFCGTAYCFAGHALADAEPDRWALTIEASIALRSNAMALEAGFEDLDWFEVAAEALAIEPPSVGLLDWQIWQFEADCRPIGNRTAAEALRGVAMAYDRRPELSTGECWELYFGVKYGHPGDE
jgi:hypothetical protein